MLGSFSGGSGLLVEGVRSLRNIPHRTSNTMSMHTSEAPPTPGVQYHILSRSRGAPDAILGSPVYRSPGFVISAQEADFLCIPVKALRGKLAFWRKSSGKNSICIEFLLVPLPRCYVL
jgi:hypothetical protein